MPNWLYELLNHVGHEEGRKAFEAGLPMSANPYDLVDFAEHGGWEAGWWCGWDEA
jgi:hypothetical protein